MTAADLPPGTAGYEAARIRDELTAHRSRRIELLAGEQHRNALHRIAAFDPEAVDRVLDELHAEARRLHPVTFRGSWPDGIAAECKPCSWQTLIEDDHGLADLQRLAAQHSGIEDPP